MNDNNIQPHATRCKSPTNLDLIVARGRLADARKWFAHLGWEALPQSERGRRILEWGAGHAWLASPDNPKRSARSWCHRWAPWLTESELSDLIAATKGANKRWSHDQCAAVLEIGVRDREVHRLHFIGADDDPNYERRMADKRKKAAARAHKYRASRSTGAKRGRPALHLTEEERLARKRAQDAKRAKQLRARKKAAAEQARTESASRKNASRDIIDIGSVTEFSVTHQSSESLLSPPPIIGRRAPQRDGARNIGVGFGPPPSIDFAAFGIIAIRVMRGSDVIQEWMR